jgi:multidrug efflux pump subunit AcrA (membrane-fusion protein)
MVRMLSLAITAMLLVRCGAHDGTHEAAQAAPRVQATVIAVARTAVDAQYEAVGTVRADASTTVQSKATGHVTAVHVKEGDLVTRGQVLVELDHREAEAQLQAAQSALRGAQDAREEVDRAVQAATHARGAAEAGADLAQSTYERFEGLMENNAVSRQAFDEANAKWRMASAETAQAGEMVASMQAKRAEVDARIEQARAQLRSAEALLTYTQVTAPFDGIVTNKTVDVGDLAAPGSPLLQVETMEQYRLEALVDESLLAHVHEGDAVPVVLDAIGGEAVAGTVAQLVPAADTASRTFVVKINLPAVPGITSGMFGRARFPMGRTEALTVPASAVAQRGQLSLVYVVGEDGVARMRLITVGRTYGDRVEVLSGLEAGEKVVSDRLETMTDGALVVHE